MQKLTRASAGARRARKCIAHVHYMTMGTIESFVVRLCIEHLTDTR